MTFVEALSEVQQSVGRAVVYSTVALIVGFLALCSSEFVPTIYFGCLVSLAMLGGLLGNLVVLPLLLRVSRDDPVAAHGPARLLLRCKQDDVGAHPGRVRLDVALCTPAWSCFPGRS